MGLHERDGARKLGGRAISITAPLKFQFQLHPSWFAKIVIDFVNLKT